jgi:hypothetical protein
VYADSAKFTRKRSCVNDKISDLSEEGVGRVPSERATRLVWVGVDEPESILIEGWGSFDGRFIGRVADELSVVQIDDGVRDEVGSVSKLDSGFQEASHVCVRNTYPAGK